MSHGSSKKLRWWWLAPLLLMVLVAVTVWLMSWNMFKPLIIERVEQTTGRSVAIEGDVKVDFLPRPEISLHGIRIGNPQWATSPHMLEARRLSVSPSLIDLLTGKLVLDVVEMAGLTLHLEQRRDAPGNWVSGDTTERETVQSSASDEEPALPVIIRHFSLSDAQVRYRAPEADAPAELTIQSLQIQRNQAFLDTEATLTFRDRRFHLEARTDPLERLLDKTQPFGGEISVGSEGDRLTSTFTLPHPPSLKSLQAEAGLSVAATANWARWLDFPVVSLGALEFATHLERHGSEWQLNNIEVSALNSRITGELELETAGQAPLLNGSLHAISSIAGGRIETNAELTGNLDSFSSEAQVTFEGLDMDTLGIALPPGNTLDGDLDLTLSSGRSTPLRLAIKGTLRDRPLNVTIKGGPLPGLIALDEDYRFEAEASSGNLQARVDTRLASLLNPSTFAGDVALGASGALDMEAWVGPVLPSLPEFRLAGRLQRDSERWSATGLKGEIGGTSVAGSVEFHNVERTEVQADLEAGHIVLARLLPEGAGIEEDSLPDLLRGVNGQLALRADSLVLADGTTLQGLALSAGLKAGRLEVDPLRFGLADGSITGRLVLDVTGQTASGSLDAVFDDIALAGLVETFTPVEDRLGRFSGELHLEMRDTLPDDRRNDLWLPFIGRVTLEPSTLRFEAPQADTDLTLRLSTPEGENGVRRFHLDGTGRYDGHPASLSLVGDSLLHARYLDRPYAVDLEAEIVGSRIGLQGILLRPLALQGQNLKFTLEGPNPQRLTRLLGVALPQLPPYSLSGNLELNDQRWTFENMKGEIGGSDLDGWLSLDTQPRPPRLTGELRSASLDIADLGFIIGATQTARKNEDRFILPDTPFVGEGWQTLAADISYRGESVRAGNLPLSKVDIDFYLENGHGRFEPVSFGIGKGSIDLVFDLDAGSRLPVGTMQVEMRRVELSDVLRHWNLADDNMGIIGGRGKFWIEGRSVAELLASADGGLLLLMTGGSLDAVLVELAGLDALQAFLSWARRRDPVPIECAYADLQARSGVAKLDTLVIDTLDTTFTAGGEMDLNTERLDISVFAHPKDASVLAGSAPFHLGGTFDDIEPGVHGSGLELGVRAGIGAVLGALSGPIAALLPLLTTGTDPDLEYCKGLVSRSHEAIRSKEGGP
ncbi:AsmA family protein [Marinobacter orientalis]|uniref:AsmA family protein n=1 Tax=Marinobacter orientalis TaxID=1928859 RepID=A0A7Y0WTK4_9GAMM|nr:AsmA family protein [Marinobacter orientalis]NMT64810.1 AsmA family protein [Marinobacter orientalis]TGX48801.1 AsmA family protein [Marinobacter orientalis]